MAKLLDHFERRTRTKEKLRYAYVIGDSPGGDVAS